jgi:NAD(P) transhydrogenase subunit alpha
MIVGVPRETFPDENRVALVPSTLQSLTRLGLEILIETGAGSAAGFLDQAYEDKGAEIVQSRSEVLERADVVCQVRTAGANPVAGQPDLELMRSGQAIIGLADPPVALEIGRRAALDRGPHVLPVARLELQP